MFVEPEAPVEAHLDYVNIVKFRRDKWCRPAEPNSRAVRSRDRMSAPRRIGASRQARRPRSSISARGSGLRGRTLRAG